jgi:hypothetical protein
VRDSFHLILVVCGIRLLDEQDFALHGFHAGCLHVAHHQPVSTVDMLLPPF